MSVTLLSVMADQMFSNITTCAALKAGVQPAVWGSSRWVQPTVIGFSSFRGSLVTRWEAPGGIGSSSGGWPTILLQYSDAVGWVYDL